MKFNTTYTPKIALKSTIEEISFLKKEFLKHLFSIVSLLEVSSPLILGDEDPRNSKFTIVTRNISFDLANQDKVARIVISPSNWLRDLIDRLNIPFNSGVFTSSKSLFRDAQIGPTSTIIKEEIIIHIKVLNYDLAKKLTQKLATQLYQLFWKMANFYAKKYQIKNIYEEDVKYVSSQFLENQNPEFNFTEREEEFAFESGAFYLTSPGRTLFSGKVHTFLPLDIYDLVHFYQLVVPERVNRTILKPLQIGILANGIQLSDQIALYGEGYKKTQSFFKKLIKQTHKVVEVRLNFPRIAMSLLEKGHISEVQPGVISEESSIIEQRYDVKKY